VQFQALMKSQYGINWELYDTNSSNWGARYAKPTTDEEARRFIERLVADRNRERPCYMKSSCLDVEIL
jgi:hypothetical protein